MKTESARCRLAISNGEDPHRRRTGEGIGLGLYLIKKIVDKRHGRIEIQTAVGTG